MNDIGKTPLSRGARVGHTLKHSSPAVPAAASADFDSLGLSPSMVQTLTSAGYHTPTPIQRQAIPVGLKGLDVIGCAATGTGKTAAFLLPIIERLSPGAGVKALILAPTRELALQILDQANRFGAHRRVTCTLLIGGVGYGEQRQHLKERRPFVIATPGRLLDFLGEGLVQFDGLQTLVLDEADRMLDMGFKPQLTRILKHVPRQRQTMLFSATMAGEVAAFARASLNAPVRVEVQRSGTTAARVTQEVYLTGGTDKAATLVSLLRRDEDSVLIFTRTKSRCDKVAKVLNRNGFAAERIHGDRSQNQRVAALEGFRSGKYRILAATDIAARGLDVDGIGHVINFDLPHVPEDYVHRIGRTGRASASGRASSLVAGDELGLLIDVERFIRQVVPRASIEPAVLVVPAGGGHKAAHHQHRTGSKPAAVGAAAQARPNKAGRRRSTPGQGGAPAGGARTERGGSAASHKASGSARVVFSGGPRRR
jgi:ATP-dependent RNA helicase RhlE